MPWKESGLMNERLKFVGRLLQGLLVQTSGRDPITLVIITTLVIVVALVACLWPARHATRLDPLAALRHE